MSIEFNLSSLTARLSGIFATVHDGYTNEQTHTVPVIGDIGYSRHAFLVSTQCGYWSTNYAIVFANHPQESEEIYTESEHGKHVIIDDESTLADYIDENGEYSGEISFNANGQPYLSYEIHLHELRLEDIRLHNHQTPVGGLTVEQLDGFIESFESDDE